MAELHKTYQPQEIEQKVYKQWEKSGFFNPDTLPLAKKRKPFTIAMPPPNITGELHVGHVLGLTIQDILTRYHRMKGRAALWIPGTDHAAISTQVVVERLLQQQGIDRRIIGREKFLEHVWAWQKQYGARIVEQTKRSGASADWSRQHFTMDPELTTATQTAFMRLYRDGLIYRGERIINWCPDCQTAISDLEVDHQETPGRLWYIRYPLADGAGQIVVATTRPETMLGDTAVAVNPKDKRYKKMIGQQVRLPLANRLIPIIADDRIKMDFGTGAVKVTPAHDPLDFDLGQTHALPSLSIIGQDGKMTALAGPGWAGLAVLEARQRVVQHLTELGWLEKEEDYIHSVGYCSRSKTPVEPLLSRQWFVKTKVLASQAMAAVRGGKIKIVPKRFTKVYFHWLKNIRDWNISRQIWWGHRLPVWYRRKDTRRDHPKVSLTSPGPTWVQDEDTLDTWFSSGLWTFSTLGWPKKTADLKRFHPTNVMVTGWDILFFWVARMIMFSLYFMKEVPFSTVYLHGLILDQEGKKMSKSKGTGIDPLIMADQYGMDALRLSLVIGNGPGQDFRLFEEKISGYRNFSNKLWNVARFIVATPRPTTTLTPITLADHWILTRLQGVKAVVTKDIDRFDFSAAGQKLYAFAWHDFADWYLEASKVRRNTAVLYTVLEELLQLLHPFMPFITEALWSNLHPHELLMVAPWPKPNKVLIHPASAKKFVLLQQTVVALRNFKVWSALPTNEPLQYVGEFDAELLKTLTAIQVKKVDRLVVLGEYREIIFGHGRFRVASAFADRYEQHRRKNRSELEQYALALKKKLTNPMFIRHAAPEVVEETKNKLAETEQQLLSL